VTRCAWFSDLLETYKDAQALHWNDQTYSYADLLHSADEWTRVFDERDVAPGAVVSVEGNWSPKTSGLALALIQRGCVYVPIGPASARERARFKDIAQVQIELRFQADDSWSLEKPMRVVDNPLQASFTASGRAGLVLFSSGSTGDSKGMLHDLEIMLEKYRTPRKALRTIIFLAFDHIGGVNTFYHILSGGGSLIIPPGRGPAEVCRTIEHAKAELLPTSPSFLNLLLLSKEYENYDLSSLQIITYGTEIMSDNTLAEIHRLFPNVRLQQTYGLSEVGILRSKSRSSDSKFVKIGGEGFTTKVVDGILWIKADGAMQGYLNAGNPFDENGWLCTGDLVEQEGEYIRFLGRQSDIINVGGEKVFPAEVENALLEMPEVRDITVIGRPHPLMGNMVVARITPVEDVDSAAEMKKKMRKFAKDRLMRFKIPTKVEIVKEDQFNYRYKKARKGGLRAKLDEEE